MNFNPTKENIMDKRTIIAKLSLICDELDNDRRYEESAMLTSVMRKLAVKDTHEDPTGEGMENTPDYKPKQNIVPGKSGMIAPLKKIHSMGLLNEKGHKFYTSKIGEDATPLGKKDIVRDSTLVKVLNKLNHWGMLNENGVMKIESLKR
jgi:hypothetical protein